MYINKLKTMVVPKGTPLNQIFPAKTLNDNEFIHILWDSGVQSSYKYAEYFNPTSTDWVRVTRIIINYTDNTVTMEEVFSSPALINTDTLNYEGC